MKGNYKFLSLFCVVLSCGFLITCMQNKKEKIASINNIQKDTKIQLCDHCPPGFELVEGNKCVFVNPYQQYQSLENTGVGGLTSALPAIRDSFSPQQIDLGRYLFFDPVLSSNKKISCASCHQPDLGFSDGKTQSIGIYDSVLLRGAPSLWNVAFLKSFFWDAHEKSLEAQMKGPLYAANEMNNTPEELLKTINSIPTYQKLFKEAFPNKKDNEVSLEEIYIAIAAFECSLISLNSKYDQYAHGYKEALNQKEIEGLNVFRSFVARCSECHTPPLFTNQQVAVLGIPEREGKPLDIGAEKTFNDTSYKAGFKVPSLRNVALTAPYMHAGIFKDLREAVSFYNKGRGHAVPKGVHLKIHWHIWEPKLTELELDRLVDFLHTLSDESFKPQVPSILPSGISIEKK